MYAYVHKWPYSKGCKLTHDMLPTERTDQAPGSIDADPGSTARGTHAKSKKKLLHFTVRAFI